MHCAQFDVRTGAVSCGPMPHALGARPPTPRGTQLLKELVTMIAQVPTLPIATFETRVAEGLVWVRLPPPSELRPERRALE
jgi:nitrite reductase/ring-hydroxylating ferredoxin subunit